jgi:hypothetical protein
MIQKYLIVIKPGIIFNTILCKFFAKKQVGIIGSKIQLLAATAGLPLVAGITLHILKYK